LPSAVARSRGASQWLTAPVSAGKFGPSEMPSRTRAPYKTPNPVASPVAPIDRLQSTAAIASTLRDPKRSTTKPPMRVVIA
jgi:hypothetical protein